ncbi:MAG: cbb3-type cytochrome oxidase assembly protein CcoS [Bacteroidetes bacterium]|jgi:cbb3-type cytochrome oxidase maturation protein|nr:cbb3-type cytochrome oxidase assembly protein CcoS [Bacteroidota bacterium]MBK9320523.1 cbb3-type cytochrome oxidase assembly protein CcoS [Bacteroidota bacterium]MBK9399306.1 cbb3-type cytochrome oxidase assembly protein CcoS [Bacteroidota bacterium]MBL0097707.1 cbb3-type cytochrome oxidase assembly protein CcoS [Bacteroidota bacterium]
MSVILILITCSLLVAGGFLAGFLWSVRTGQFDDDISPAVRILFDDETVPKPIENKIKNPDNV